MQTEIRERDGKFVITAKNTQTGESWVCAEFDSAWEAMEYLPQLTIDRALEIKRKQQQ